MIRLSVIDAWLLTDSRPETNYDGRHYSGENEDTTPDRPLIGEADGIRINEGSDLCSQSAGLDFRRIYHREVFGILVGKSC